MSTNRKMWMMSAWMRPIIQITDLMRSTGFALSPQIARPFLGQNIDLHKSKISNITTASASTVDHQGPPRVQFAYWIMSALDTVMVVVCISMYAWSNIRNETELREVSDDKNELIPDESGRLLNTEDTLKPSSGKIFLESAAVPHCILLSVIFLFSLAYGAVAVQKLILYTYLYEYLRWSVGTSTLVVTMCQVMRFVFGATVAVITHWVSPTWLSITNLVMFFSSSVLMLLGSLGFGDAFTVIGLVPISFTGCNMYPTTISLLEETLHVTAPIMALFLSSIGTAVVILGPVAGTLLHKTGATALPLMLLVGSLTAILLFVIYSIITRVNSTVYKQVLMDKSPSDTSSNNSSDEL